MTVYHLCQGYYWHSIIDDFATANWCAYRFYGVVNNDLLTSPLVNHYLIESSSTLPEIRLRFMPISEKHFRPDCLKGITASDSVGNLNQSVHGFCVAIRDLEVEVIENRDIPLLDIPTIDSSPMLLYGHPRNLPKS